ncbi:hypothetical protein QUS22_01575 [Wolbachia pipientis]|nr:hypothetical protein [Wolbachia pipientis]MDM8335082.1 hypothetical protein [Wolbachia pipientis]
MHRLHLEDLTGHLLSKPKNIWHHAYLPMIYENKEVIYSTKKPVPPVPVIRVTTDEYTNNKSWITASHTTSASFIPKKGRSVAIPLDGGKKEVEMIKAELGSYAFAAQYQQNPLLLSNGIIKREWL